VSLTGDHYRVVQLHPTRLCNLRCLHCYSSSGPDQHGELDGDLLGQVLSDARAEGFTVAGFSGGEPLLYSRLGEVLRHARELGMITTVTSNGMLLDERRLKLLVGAVDLLAISLDGVPASHNRMRASDRAFETMVGHLDALRQTGIRFGFIFTLTLHNLHELEWVVNFAIEQGAKLLQVHPLEEVGRARQALPGARPDTIEAAYAYLEVSRLQALVGDRLRIQLDLANRNALRTEPERVFAGELSSDYRGRPLAEVLSPVIVEADGTVVPIQHGFGRAYALGNVHDHTFRELAAQWLAEGYPAFRCLCQSVFQSETQPAELPMFNWYEAITRESVSLITSQVGTGTL
jgi:MoaA/NifB/PqqE/SkfB family radical SAM enzyme